MSCVICFESVVETNALICSCPSCKQTIGHCECVEKWVLHKHTCPLCNFNIQHSFDVTVVTEPFQKTVELQQTEIHRLTHENNKLVYKFSVTFFIACLEFIFLTMNPSPYDFLNSKNITFI